MAEQLEKIEDVELQEEQEEQQDENENIFENIFDDVTRTSEEELNEETDDEEEDDEETEEGQDGEEKDEEPDEKPEGEPSEESKGLDDYKVPDNFESKDEALKWYAERYDELLSKAQQPEKFTEEILEKQEREISGFKNAYLAMQKNPKEFFMQYMPEVLAQNGISPVLNEEQMVHEVERALQLEFGADYKSQYNPEDLINPRSYSTKLLNRMTKIRADLESRNEQNQKLMDEWNQNLAEGKSNIPKQQANPEEVRRMAEEQFPRFKDYGFNEQEFKEFLDEAEKMEPIQLEDLHKILYFDGYLEEAYKQGLNEGQKNVSNSFKPAARKMPDSVSRLLAQKEQEQRTQEGEKRRRSNADYFKGLEYAENLDIRIPNY